MSKIIQNNDLKHVTIIPYSDYRDLTKSQGLHLLNNQL